MPGVEARATEVLRTMNAAGRFPMSLVCTDRGLLVAAAGESVRSEVAAGLTGLFDVIVERAGRDLELADVDEFTVSDARVGRLVVRPLARGRHARLFLVAQVPPHRAWRKATNTALRDLRAILRPLLADHTDESRET